MVRPFTQDEQQGNAMTCQYKYRVIHKSVKHFKNSQQIHYSTDHGSSYADTERNSPSFFFFYIFHRCSMYSPLVIRQTSMRQSISFHARQHITFDQSHSSGVSQRQIRATMCAGFSLKKTSTVCLSTDVRITTIRCVVHLLRIF